jgi:excisionase family DNA binding protein
MTLDDSLRAAVAEAVAPLARELRQIRERLDKSLPPPFGSRAEAARALGCCLTTIDRLVAEGEVGYKRVGRRVLIDLTTLRPPSAEEVAAAKWTARGGR